MTKQRPKIKFANRHISLPASRAARLGLGVLLIIGGILGFLPILGFWMIPLGVLVVSYDIAIARRARRKTAVWWQRRNGNGRKTDKSGGTPNTSASTNDDS